MSCLLLFGAMFIMLSLLSHAHPAGQTKEQNIPSRQKMLHINRDLLIIHFKRFIPFTLLLTLFAVVITFLLSQQRGECARRPPCASHCALAARAAQCGWGHVGRPVCSGVRPGGERGGALCIAGLQG